MNTMLEYYLKCKHTLTFWMLAMNEEIKGKAKGGLARAAKLSAEERSIIARKAAIARHSAGKIPVAIRKGNFFENFGFDADCYVLNDVNKTAVMTQRGIAMAIGLSNPGGNDFQRLVDGKNLSKYLGAEVRQKIEQPIEFEWIYPGDKQSKTVIRSYSFDILIDVCNAIISADESGDIRSNRSNIANRSRAIVNASAKSGITRLVYSIAGYNPTTEEVIEAFKTYIQEEARKYEQEFPNELYMQWHRLYQIPVPVRGKPWQFKHLTVNHIYYPLAKSNGKILELIRAMKAKDGDRQKKLFQFLNYVGARALRIQIGRVLEMSESSSNQGEYENKILERFGGQQELDFA